MQGYQTAKRIFDVAVALALSPFALLLMGAVAVAVKITSRGPALIMSRRVGRGGSRFWMAKVRTMRVDTPQVATHLLDDPGQYLTPVGGFLRKTSLDELPQLWNILKGDMSFVGPRPALFNQDDLVALREKYGINDMTPGLTGWAQVTGRDELAIPEKVAREVYYKERQSFWFDLRIIWMTVVKVAKKEGVRH
jgi:O-antigen biosynthesis protein WbqP